MTEVSMLTPTKWLMFANGEHLETSKHDVQRFLGLVQYLAHFMPNVSAYTGTLAAIQKNGHPFLWIYVQEIYLSST
jgi:hypothetical protein